jgi:mannose-6-phosphate isomerase-like protein (cupin superfamily)
MTTHGGKMKARDIAGATSGLVEAIDLSTTYVHLEDGATARPVPVGPDFWETIDRRTDLAGGRLMLVFHNAADWPTWETHPAGEEIVYLLSGAVDLVLEEPEGERTVALRPGQAVIVPRGVWHRGIVHTPGDTLHITRGEGTRNRPV